MRQGKLRELYDCNIDMAVMYNLAMYNGAALNNNLNPYRDKPIPTDEERERRRQADMKLGAKLFGKFLTDNFVRKKRKKT